MAITINIVTEPRVYAQLITSLADRLCQEEIWSQTVWPEEEPELTEEIVRTLGPADLEFALTLARQQLGVGKLGWES